MLIKRFDELTLHAVAALNALYSDASPQALKAALEDAQSHPHRRGPPFKSDAVSALNFSRVDASQKSSPLSQVEAQALLKSGEPLKAVSAIGNFRTGDASEYERFLTGRSHESWGVNNEGRPLLFGWNKRGAMFAATEGLDGRRYNCTLEQFLEFLKTGPLSRRFLEHLETEFKEELRMGSPEGVEAFLRLRHTDEKLDYFLSLLDDQRDYFLEGPLGSSAVAALLRPCEQTRATLDLEVWSAAEERPFYCAPFKQAEENLLKALRAITSFAADEHLENESRAFRDALTLLESQRPQAASKLWLAAKLPAERFNLYRAAMAADVFSGMASWNDVSTDATQEERFHRVSNEVVLCIAESLCSSING